MNMYDIAIAENIAWIASGKIGCVFASALVKQREKIGWKFYGQDFQKHYYDDDHTHDFIVSLVFPGLDVKLVRRWALQNKFYEQTYHGSHVYKDGTNDVFEGLRRDYRQGTAWVQYFGPDSHVVTRQAPFPMLSWTRKLPAHIYAQTMAKGLLHLAHASIEFVKAEKAHTLWDRSFEVTKKLLGRSPGLAEAAKVTFQSYQGHD